MWIGVSSNDNANSLNLAGSLSAEVPSFYSIDLLVSEDEAYYQSC